MNHILSLVYTVCFIFILFHVTKFEFKLRLKYKWYFGLFNSLCLSVAELILLVYLFEKWAFKDPKIYLYFLALYDHCFAYVFMGFNHALIDFQASIVPFPPEKLAKIQSQKFLFSLMMLAAFISLRHIVFAACHYQKSYLILKKIDRYSDPKNDIPIYLLMLIVMTVVALTVGSFSNSCLVLEPGCKDFTLIPSKKYVILPNIQYLFISYLILYLFLICKLKSLDDSKTDVEAEKGSAT